MQRLRNQRRVAAWLPAAAAALLLLNPAVGAGQEDAFNYNANGVGQSLDMPTLNPANRATVLGNYTGFVPPGFIAATVVPFSVTFKGPATLVAQ